MRGLSPDHYPQVCFSSRDQDRSGYRWVAWVDGFNYSDGGQPPWDTYCADARDPACVPQPGQLHGEVVVTLHEGANNIVTIPLNQ